MQGDKRSQLAGEGAAWSTQDLRRGQSVGLPSAHWAPFQTPGGDHGGGRYSGNTEFASSTMTRADAIDPPPKKLAMVWPDLVQVSTGPWSRTRRSTVPGDSHWWASVRFPGRPSPTAARAPVPASVSLVCPIVPPSHRIACIPSPGPQSSRVLQDRIMKNKISVWEG